MTFTFIGLGNPGEEYKHTRHNTGRIMLEYFRTANDFPEWKVDKKSQALISKGKIGKHTITLVYPETFMNKSGVSAKTFVTNLKSEERMLVIYDDLDLPFGSSKISFNKSSLLSFGKFSKNYSFFTYKTLAVFDLTLAV